MTITSEKLISNLRAWLDDTYSGPYIHQSKTEVGTLLNIIDAQAARIAALTAKYEPISADHSKMKIRLAEQQAVIDQRNGECDRLINELAALRQKTAPVAVPSGLHPDTADLIKRFATALADKLYAAQQKYGYCDDWKKDGWPSQCQAHFHQHIAKGDPRDVAAYCAFMWHHGWITELPVPPVAVPEDIKIRKALLWIEGVIAKKPGMKEAVTCSEVLRLNSGSKPE